jgi:hypothetical protein
MPFIALVCFFVSPLQLDTPIACINKQLNDYYLGHNISETTTTGKRFFKCGLSSTSAWIETQIQPTIS